MSTESYLDDLIRDIENNREQNSKYVKNIGMLISSLKNLRDLIGNNKVKKSVADQVAHLIITKKMYYEGKLKEDNDMLNTVLYGPPGVGKTLIGNCLSKIWYSIGYLDGSKNPKNNKAILGSILGDKSDNSDQTQPGGLLVIIGTIVFIVIAIIGFLKGQYDSSGLYWTIAVLLMLIIIISLVIYYYQYPGDNSETKNKDLPHLTSSDREEKDNNYDLMTVVSRSDFVDKYVGWTDKKTLKLLNNNLGKVLFVDEAYSLITGSFDHFGMEAVNTINKFLSEHPKEIIVIFAGYQDKIKESIFSHQPGLERRFMWHFECDGYNGSELFEIFNIQLAKKKRQIYYEDIDRVRDLIIANSKYFNNYGGDTERLAFFTSLEHSKSCIKNKDANPNVVNFYHVEMGLNRFKENRPRKDDDQKPNNDGSNSYPPNRMEKFLELFMNGQNNNYATIN